MRVCVFVCVVCVCVGGNDKKKTIIIMLHGAGRDRRAWLRCAIVTRSLLTYSRSLLIYCGSLLTYARCLLTASPLGIPQVCYSHWVSFDI